MTHPLAAEYGNAPWSLYEADGPDGTTWTCRLHQWVRPFGENLSVDYYSTRTSGFLIGSICVECAAGLDPEIAERRAWWWSVYAK